ncbi:unnamed protein product, partial [Mesorhabditis spiculigera]
MGICMSFISGSFAIITYCGLKIWSTLKAAPMSKKTRKLQLSLFKALLVQTLIPTIFEYAPSGVVLLCPIAALPIDTTFVTVSFGIYSFVEPIAMIYFVRDYRNAILRYVPHWVQMQVTPATIYESTSAHRTDSMSGAKTLAKVDPNEASKY